MNRDELAQAILLSMLDEFGIPSKAGDGWYQNIATRAYTMADAMATARHISCVETGHVWGPVLPGVIDYRVCRHCGARQDVFVRGGENE